MRPRVYFAGKIFRRDWRCEILHDSRAGGVDFTEVFNPELTVDREDFVYGGPFFVSCDHGCAHGPGNHAVKEGCTEEGDHLRSKVWKANLQRIRRAEILFAYVNEVDCFGTMVEIGIAAQRKIPMGVAFGPSITDQQYKELWMLRAPALHVSRGSMPWSAWVSALWILKQTLIHAKRHV
jgi:hypothetical protein